MLLVYTKCAFGCPGPLRELARDFKGGRRKNCMKQSERETPPPPLFPPCQKLFENQPETPPLPPSFLPLPRLRYSLCCEEEMARHRYVCVCESVIGYSIGCELLGAWCFVQRGELDPFFSGKWLFWLIWELPAKRRTSVMEMATLLWQQQWFQKNVNFIMDFALVNKKKIEKRCRDMGIRPSLVVIILDCVFGRGAETRSSSKLSYATRDPITSFSPSPLPPATASQQHTPTHY